MQSTSTKKAKEVLDGRVRFRSGIETILYSSHTSNVEKREMDGKP